MRTSPIQTAYSSAELSPLLYGRIDYTRFQTGLRTCNGFLPLQQGAVTRGPGTTYDGQTRLNRRARLIAFEFAIDDSMIIELTANDTGLSEPAGGTMRFWRYGALIEKAGAPYELSVPFGQSDIDRLQWVQSADVIYIVDGSRPMQRLERRALDDWAIADLTINDGPFRNGNVDKAITVQVGQAGTTLGDQVIAIEGDAVELYGAGDPFDAGMLGTLIQVQPFEYRNVALWLSNKTYAVGNVVRSNGNIYQDAEHVGGSNSGSTPPSHTEGEWISDNQNIAWRYVSDGRGVIRITEIDDANRARGTVVRAIPIPCTTSPTYRWAESAWSGKNGYPSAIALYEQRLIAAATPVDPRTMWFSTVGSFSSFGGGAEADDAFAYAVAGTTSLNRIIWMEEGRRGLHVGALGQEFSIRSDSAGQVIGPTTFQLGTDSSIGSHEAMTIAPDGKPIFIAKDKRRVYEMRYAFEDDANRPVELSLPAEHLGSRGFEEVVWQAGEQRVAWYRMSDGTMTVMLHDPQENVLGWAPYSVAGGFVEGIATYSDPATSRDVLILSVRRTIGGQDVRTMERLAPVFGLTTTPSVDAHHLFCATRQIVDPPQVTFSVPHLAGAGVVAWTEAGSTPVLTVAGDGTVTLPQAAASALIGLFDETHEVETLPIQATSREGDTTGRQLRLMPGHGIRLHRTAAGLLQTVERDPVRGKRTSDAQPIVPAMIADDGQTLFSGVVEAQAYSGNAKEVSHRVTPVGGAPITVLTITSMISEAGG